MMNQDFTWKGLFWISEMLITCILFASRKCCTRKEKVDELSLLNRLTGDENGIDEKAGTHFKHIYCPNEYKARKVWITFYLLTQGIQREDCHLNWTWFQENKVGAVERGKQPIAVQFVPVLRDPGLYLSVLLFNFYSTGDEVESQSHPPGNGISTAYLDRAEWDWSQEATNPAVPSVQSCDLNISTASTPSPSM